MCRLMVYDGYSAVEAHRKVLGWKCETNTRENQRARDFTRRVKVKEYVEELKVQATKEAEAADVVTNAQFVDTENLKKFAFKRLTELRDDPLTPATSRLKAIESLEKLSDPSKDANLIWRWVDVLVRGTSVHCPCCHETYSAEELELPNLEEYRKEYNIEEGEAYQDLFERRNAIIEMADKAKSPHIGQRRALAALERHIVGLGAARAGKSYLMALFALLYFLCPGTEVWILARIYDDARSEVEYLQNFIQSLFYPLVKHMVTTHHDSKTGEWTMTSRWGSEIKIKSAKAQGSLTGRELDAMLAAEPGWIPDNVYNHVRARLVSRLGRIIALGTPQGMGGFISRMVFTTGRDPKTGVIKRLTPDERLIANGAPWNISALIMDLSPTDNPSYVKAELDAARQEMSDEEYASEFEGRMMSSTGMKFHAVAQRHLQEINRLSLQECEWTVGIDQGDKNFGVCLMGYDGHRVYVMKDYFDNSYNTIKTNLVELRRQIPVWIQMAGGDPARWNLTIFDQDPPVDRTLDEMEQEGQKWPTATTRRHDNKKKEGLTEDWRRETTTFFNEMAKQDRIVFDMEVAQLHDEVMRTENVVGNLDTDGGGTKAKGWKISGSWRQDHVLDGMMLALWTIVSQQIIMARPQSEVMNPLEEARRAFEYNVRVNEERELSGFAGQSPRNPDKVFSDVFGRPRTGGDQGSFIPTNGSHYKDY